MRGRSGMVRGALGVIVLVVSVVGFAACGSEDSGGEKSTKDASSDSGRFASSACFACVQAGCLTAFSDCGSEPTCAGYLDCVRGCPTTADGNVEPSCESTCPAASGAGIAARDAVRACLFGSAAQSCPSCGAVDAGSDATEGGTHPILSLVCPPSSIADPCNKCQAEKCCDYFDAIQNGSDTSKLADCWLACTTAQCEQGCYDQFPAGIPDFAAWGACLSVLCIAPGDCKAAGGACGLCTYQQCPLEYVGCDADVECFLALQCTLACNDGDVACMQACRDAHPSADSLYDQYLTCIQLKCAPVCGGG